MRPLCRHIVIIISKLIQSLNGKTHTQRTCFSHGLFTPSVKQNFSYIKGTFEFVRHFRKTVAKSEEKAFHVRPSICEYGTYLLPLDELSQNFVFECSLFVDIFQFLLNSIKSSRKFKRILTCILGNTSRVIWIYI